MFNVSGNNVFSHVTAMFVNMELDNKDHIWIKICICLKDTLHRSCWKNFQL